MMIRNIRKAISILCAIALLLSICVVSFAGASSAAPVSKEDGIQTWEPVLDLNFDSISNKEDVVLGYANLQKVNLVPNVTGKDGQPSQAIKLEGKGHAVLFGSQGSAPVIDANKTYRLSYDVKYLAGTGFGGKVGSGMHTINGTASGSKDTKSRKNRHETGIAAGTLAEDTQWFEYSKQFKGSDLSTNLAKYLHLWVCTNEGINQIVYIDNFKLEVLGDVTYPDVDNSYVFDYKDGETAQDIEEAFQNLKVDSGYNVSNKHYAYSNMAKAGNANMNPTEITDEGLVWSVYANNAFTTDKFGYNLNAALYDADAVEGGVLRIKTNATYLVTVKYKVTDLGGNKSVGIGVSAFLGKKVGTLESHATRELAIAEHTRISSGWEYLTVCFDTADETYSTGDAGIVGCPIGLTGRAADSKNAMFLVDSVVIQEKRTSDDKEYIGLAFVDGDSVTGELVVKGQKYPLPLSSNPPAGKAFEGWVAENGDIYTVADFENFAPTETMVFTSSWSNAESSVLTLYNNGTPTDYTLKVGDPIPRPLAPNSAMFFLGWVEDYEAEYDASKNVTVVPKYDTVLYAKYTGTYINFDENTTGVGTTYTAENCFEAGYKPTLVADPDNADNTVLEIFGKSVKAGVVGQGVKVNEGANFNILDSVTGQGAYLLKNNTTYAWSFKVKAAAKSDKIQFRVMRGDATSGTNTHRTFIKQQLIVSANEKDVAGEWMTFSGTFTTGDTMYLDRTSWAKENKLFLSIMPGAPTEGVTEATVYVDDIVVSEVLTEAPAGTVSIKFETNGPEISDVFGYAGDKIVMPEDPKVASAKFVGWYTDKALTKAFTADRFGETNIVLYAKWQGVDFVVDFTDYEPGSASAVSKRAKFMKDGENDYLDWWVTHDTVSSNTSDSSTPYRVFLNKNTVHYDVVKGQTYEITFKYKLLQGEVKFAPVTNALLNGWSAYKVQTTSLTANKTSDEWVEGKLNFMAVPNNNTGVYLSLGIAGHGHVLVDDIMIKTDASVMNLYGTTKLYLNLNGGNGTSAVSGDAGEAIPKLPSPTKAGHIFAGWYSDQKLSEKFAEKVFADEDMNAYAAYRLGQFYESYEDFPNTVIATGFAGAYKLYNKTTATDFDKTNVQKGSTSVFRDGKTKGTKAFTLSRSTDIALTVGEQYTIEFYVKPTNVGDAAGTISLYNMASSTTGINSPTSKSVIATVGDLKAGEWNKVTYTFTAENKYLAIATTADNDMYFDNFVVTDKDYNGTSTGDNTVSPFIVIMMVVLAAGALTITGKKVFDK